MPNEKHHFWLSTGHVVFVEKEEGGRQFRTREYNSLLKTKAKSILLKEVSSCQHAFFLRATQEVDQTKVNTIDMVVTNMTYLGYFSEKEFTEGVNMPPAEKPQVSDESVKFQ